jgi:hypothetical protein
MSREINAWRDSISHWIDNSKELDDDVNFPKIHLMSHRAKHIRRYGTLQQYCADRHEQANNTILNDSWNASNHNLNNLAQVITFQRSILCFKIRELNLQALAPHQVNSVSAFKVLPAGGDLVATLSPPVTCEARIHWTLELP